MRHLTDKDVTDALGRQAPSPPPGLASSIKKHIPAELFPEEEGPVHRASPSHWRSRSAWLAAASITFTLGSAYFVSQRLSSDPTDLVGAPVMAPERFDAPLETPRAQAQIPLEVSARIVSKGSLDEDHSATAATTNPGDGRSSEIRHKGSESQSDKRESSDLSAQSRASALPGSPGSPEPVAEDLEPVRKEPRSRSAAEKQINETRRDPAQGPAQEERDLLLRTLVSEQKKLRGLEPEMESRLQRGAPAQGSGAEQRAFLADKLEALETETAKQPGTSRVAAAVPPPPSPAAQTPARQMDRIADASLARGASLDAPRPAEIAPPVPPRKRAESATIPADMFFDATSVSPFIDTEDDRLSTFGLDVDTGSFTLARSYLRSGTLPPNEAIRVEEFLNYFDFGDSSPKRDDFALSVEGSPSPFSEGEQYRLVRLGIAAREIDTSDRRPANLVFLIDASGSMARDNRIGVIKQALRQMATRLTPSDRVGIVTYRDRAEVLLEPTSDRLAIDTALATLRPSGSTNLAEGLGIAYALVARNFRAGGINRILLCSDGVANVGSTSADAILSSVDAAVREGIEITSIGVGMGNYNDALMEQLADRSNGSYHYVDSPREAERVLIEKLTGTLETIARDAKVQVEWNGDVVSRYRLLGYENRAIVDGLFRNDATDAGEIGAGHRVSAVYELRLATAAQRRAQLGTLTLRYESATDNLTHELQQPIRQRDLAATWGEASPSLRLAVLVAELAEILRGSYWARGAGLEELLPQLQEPALRAAHPAQVEELEALIARAIELR